MNTKFVIPSYRRAETCARTTVSLLASLGVNPADVYIYLSDYAGEARDYRKALPISFQDRLFRGEPGLIANRWRAIKELPEGTHIVSFDDDVRGINRFINKKQFRPVTRQEFLTLIGTAFHACDEEDTGLWCVYPVSNPFFMGNKIRVGYYYAEGSMYGFINEHDPALSPTIQYKEDFERSLLYYKKYGAIIRLDYICYETRFWKEPGGLQADGNRTTEAEQAAVREMLRKYPTLCKVNTAKKDRLELKLVDLALEGL